MRRETMVHIKYENHIDRVNQVYRNDSGVLWITPEQYSELAETDDVSAIYDRIAYIEHTNINISSELEREQGVITIDDWSDYCERDNILNSPIIKIVSGSKEIVLIPQTIVDEWLAEDMSLLVDEDEDMDCKERFHAIKQQVSDYMRDVNSVVLVINVNDDIYEVFVEMIENEDIVSTNDINGVVTLAITKLVYHL